MERKIPELIQFYLKVVCSGFIGSWEIQIIKAQRRTKCTARSTGSNFLFYFILWFYIAFSIAANAASFRGMYALFVRLVRICWMDDAALCWMRLPVTIKQYNAIGARASILILCFSEAKVNSGEIDGARQTISARNRPQCLATCIAKVDLLHWVFKCIRKHIAPLRNDRRKNGRIEKFIMNVQQKCYESISC